MAKGDGRRLNCIFIYCYIYIYLCFLRQAWQPPAQQPAEGEKSETSGPRKTCGVSNLAMQDMEKSLQVHHWKTIQITRHLGPRNQEWSSSTQSSHRRNDHESSVPLKTMPGYSGQISTETQWYPWTLFRTTSRIIQSRPACTKWGLPWEASFPSANGSGAERDRDTV